MGEFCSGDWAINTTRKASVSICAVISEYPCLYVVSDDKTPCSYYITDEEQLIPYDKYWFDREENKDV